MCHCGEVSSTPAPAEAYAAARGRSARPRLAEFAGTLPFDLDGFQRSACSALEDGHGVLVCAPTGAGKTVVGEFAVHLALASGPQVLLHHADQGAVQPEVRRPGRPARRRRRRPAHRRHRVNGDAQVVVMTTEVLRNMIYAGSAAAGATSATS